MRQIIGDPWSWRFRDHRALREDYRGFSHSFGSLFREFCTFLRHLAHSGVKNTARNEICTGDSPPDAFDNSPDMPGNPPDVLDSQADTLDEWPYVIGKLPPPDD